MKASGGAQEGTEETNVASVAATPLATSSAVLSIPKNPPDTPPGVIFTLLGDNIPVMVGTQPTALRSTPHPITAEEVSYISQHYDLELTPSAVAAIAAFYQQEREEQMAGSALTVAEEADVLYGAASKIMTSSWNILKATGCLPSPPNLCCASTYCSLLPANFVLTAESVYSAGSLTLKIANIGEQQLPITHLSLLIGHDVSIESAVP